MKSKATILLLKGPRQKTRGYIVFIFCDILMAALHSLQFLKH